MEKKGFLNSNALKIIACVLMVIDHTGMMFFSPDSTINFVFRAIGRLSFPIFAYCIAEGCRYTRNKAKYFLTVSIFGLICTIAFFVVMKQLYFNVLITFCFSLLLIFSYQKMENYIREGDNFTTPLYGGLTLLLVVAVYVFNYICCPQFTGLLGSECYLDYGFFGALLPLLVYIAKKKYAKLLMLTVGCVLLSVFSSHPIQWFCLLSVPIVLCYSGERGKWNLKYFFYLFYPAQFLLLELIYILIYVL